jgi:hypothetical protein
MPTYDYICEVCGTSGRAWRPEGQPPRFCSLTCKGIGCTGKGIKPIKWIITPELHDRIKKVYQRDTGNGQVAALAKSAGIPRWKITRYAMTQGWIAKQKKGPNWCDEEDTVLEKYGHLAPESIQRKLRKSGFSRSISAIVNRRKKLRIPKNLQGYSANQLAECLGIDQHFVKHAIDQGRLKAKRRGTKRTVQQGGDMYFIREKWIRDYIRDNIHEIDLRKVDKYWFVDILTS